MHKSCVLWGQVSRGGWSPGHWSFFSRQYESSRGLLPYRPDADVTLTSCSYPPSIHCTCGGSKAPQTGWSMRLKGKGYHNLLSIVPNDLYWRTVGCKTGKRLLSTSDLLHREREREREGERETDSPEDRQSCKCGSQLYRVCYVRV
jgi:hypothetical protein